MSTAFTGTSGNNTITSIRNGTGDNYGSGATITNPDSSQIHVWGNAGSDTINIGFNNISGYAKGHHIRGDEKRFNSGLFADSFVFQDLDEVQSGATVVGRIEDFDASRDSIKIGNTVLNLSAGSGTASGYDWKVVEWDADDGDSALGTQQWLYIDTGGGHVFYALEGARVAPTGDGGAGGDQEDHFIREANLPSNFSSLQAVGFVDPVNYVPSGFTAQGGVTINDYDDDFSEVQAPINGSSNGDLIAAGLNDDLVYGKDGDDRIWGGTGNDTLNAEDGADTVHGGNGDDLINGGNDTDRDYLYGEAGDDTIEAGDGGDYVYGGDGNDVLYEGGGSTRFWGGGGADTFVYGVGSTTGDEVKDFSIGEDIIDLSAWNASSVNDLIFWGSSTTTYIRDVDNNRLRLADIDVADAQQQLTNDDFIFAAGSGGNSVTGTAGADLIDGLYPGISSGDDTVDALAGNDTVYAGDGDDEIQGGDGADSIFGENGNDLINGGNDTDRDYLYGGTGDDTIEAGDGGDYVYGGDGNDVLYEGGGSTRFWGGDGADTFVYGVGSTTGDEIKDFSIGEDIIDLSAWNASSVNDLIFWGSSTTTYIRDVDNNRLRLADIDVADAQQQLTNDDFLF